ncbi:uncharacterized protein VTP21DRAFT_7384 [Calcarisporiella thermophila]|uniref:uncharacterized protein n=1 Tax=Calcarisporiella thermophila TaxID=911321 RepID=UPI00374254BE
MSTNVFMVTSLLDKMSNEDLDFRYMAANDLMNELQKDTFYLEESSEKRVVAAVLNLMNDKNGEVQSLAVKCLSPLVKKIHEAQLQDIVDQLCNFATQNKKEELRDIASIGLKTVIVEIPPNSPITSSICTRLVPKLMEQIDNKNTSYEVQMDALDILSEVLNRFGVIVSANPQLPKSIQATLLSQLGHRRPAVRKRAIVAIGNLVSHTNDELFYQLVEKLFSEFNTSNDRDKLKSLIQCVGTLSRSSAQRLGKHLVNFLQLVFKYSKEEDDELREYCLQTLEAFVLKCPTEITPYIDNIIDLCLEYLKYDPNYADEDENEDEDDVMEDDAEDTDEEVDEDYSDDDDISWKLRRASSKVLAAVIGTRHELLPQLYQTVAPALINRFKEREESVRVDILQTFIVLLQQTSIYGGEGTGSSLEAEEPGIAAKKRKGMGTVARMETEESPKQLLRALIPKLTRALSKQFMSKSVQTRQTGFVLLRELVTVLPGGLDEHVQLFIPAVEASLSGAGAEIRVHHHQSSSNLKIEVLSFLRQLFATHSPAVLHPHILRLYQPIAMALEDKFYKITSEAFLVCIELIRVMRPISQGTVQSLDPAFLPIIQGIYATTVSRVVTSDADQEVKERSITCLGVLMAQAGDTLVDKHKECFALLLDRLRNEITRLTTVRTFATIADSRVCTSQEMQEAMLTAVDEIAQLLRKNNRQLRVASLGCLEALVKRYGRHLRTESYTRLLVELLPLISDADLHLLPMSLATTVSILHANSSSIEEVRKDIVPAVLRLVQSPLVQGAALDSVLTLFATLVRINGSDFRLLFDGLVKPLYTEGNGKALLVLSKQAYATIAQCVAALCLNSEANCGPTVERFAADIADPEASVSVKYLALLAVGEIGRRVDLSHHKELHGSILELFNASSEEIKSAAAYALGNISVGNVQRYLPVVISEIKEQPKRRYLLLHALKEIIARCSHPEKSGSLDAFADELWALLFDDCDSEEEGTRNVVAECLGKLTLTNPHRFLPDLQKRLQSASPQTRGTVVTAIKYTFTDEKQSYDDLLRPLIFEFLSMMKDGDLNVRRLSLSTLNSAAYNKPYTIRDVLDQLLPLLYEETVAKPELIRTVDMGPFKHRVDDGLEIRKSAFECMYTLLETCLERIDIFKFMDRVLEGLKDQHDIKMLAHLMLIRLAAISPTALTQKLDETVEPLRATLNHQVKQNAVKQEIEKNTELVRSALRAICTLARLSEPAVTPKFDGLLREVRSATGPLAEEYRSILAEVESAGASGHRGDYMDLS